jgi:hypothetical protein
MVTVMGTDTGYLMTFCFDRYHMHANSEGMMDGIGECIMEGTQVLVWGNVRRYRYCMCEWLH